MSQNAPDRPVAIVITALEVETRAVVRHLTQPTSETHSGTGFIIGEFEGWTVAVAEAGPGNSSAAAITTRACSAFNPHVAMFVGVAGGVKDVSIGDVVVATDVHGYEGGKDTDEGLRRRGSPLPVAHAIEQRARILRVTEDWRSRLDPNLDHRAPALFVEPIAAGEKVVASSAAATALWLQQEYGDVVAIEMEGRGFLEGVYISHPVQGGVVRGISDLLSGKAEADRGGSQQRAADAASAVAFQLLSGFGWSAAKSAAKPPRDGSGPAETINAGDLSALAEALLEAGRPPSIAALFPSASAAARSAIDAASAVKRTVTQGSSSDAKGDVSSIPIDGLSFLDTRMHLVLGPGGSGKTHALWRTGREMADRGDIVPIYLPAGQAKRWDDLIQLIADAAPALTPLEVINDARVCLLIDGWSEFGASTQAEEKQKAIRALRTAKVIANGRVTAPEDAPFKTWTLDLLSPRQVADSLQIASPGEPTPSTGLLDLLRLPLSLSLHILSGPGASTTGSLLRRLHDQLARDLPEAFTAALAQAVAATSLTGERSWGRFVATLKARATAHGLKESLVHLHRLGAIGERNGQALPIHDLYWSWLAGIGLTASPLAPGATNDLRTRESYLLALQSGTLPPIGDIEAALKDDLELAALFARHDDEPQSATIFDAAVTKALASANLPVRTRGSLAGLISGRSRHLRGALDTLRMVTEAGLYVAPLIGALDPARLYEQRGVLGDWIGAPGSELVLNAIAKAGGAEWSSWLLQVAAEGKISHIDAVATALGCTGEIPSWCNTHLDALIDAKPWQLRAATGRRANLAVARYIADDYERIVEKGGPGSGGWFDVNKALVACGDDAVFESLLRRFDAMGAKSQELLGYAVVDRGQPWIAAFQAVAFAKPPGRQHHKLAEIVSPQVDDTTARAWIAAGWYEAGWRVLVARHGEAVVPELIDQLPTSFADLHVVPALEVMRFLEDTPATLPNVLWSRVGSPMQPKAMQDLLNAVARAFPEGMAMIVDFICQRPGSIPAYHVAQSVRLYDEWRERSGTELKVGTSPGNQLPYPRWIAIASATANWENTFTPRLLAREPDVAVEFVLTTLKGDLGKCEEVLKVLDGLSAYHEGLLEFMLATPELAKLVPKVFAGAFDVFPVTALERCLKSQDVDQDEILWRLGATSNPLHQAVHAKLIARVLSAPTDLHKNRYVANMLRGHTLEVVKDLLSGAPGVGEDRWLWLVREVEAARQQRLISEDGSLRAA